MQELDDLARQAATGKAAKDADMAGARDAAEQIRTWVSISCQSVDYQAGFSNLYCFAASFIFLARLI